MNERCLGGSAGPRLEPRDERNAALARLSDCMKIEELSDGRFAVTSTALCQLSGEDADPVSLVETDYLDEMSEA
jgi:hypothetical protein